MLFIHRTEKIFACGCCTETPRPQSRIHRTTPLNDSHRIHISSVVPLTSFVVRTHFAFPRYLKKTLHPIYLVQDSHYTHGVVSRDAKYRESYRGRRKNRGKGVGFSWITEKRMKALPTQVHNLLVSAARTCTPYLEESISLALTNRPPVSLHLSFRIR